MKKWILRILLLVVLVILGLTLYIECNKKAIARQIIAVSNEMINGKITYSDVSVSFLSTFPNIDFGLNDLVLFPEEHLDSNALFKSSSTHTQLNLIDLILGKTKKIRSILLKDTELYLLELEDGSTNYKILKDNSSDNSPVDLTIGRIEIENGLLNYTSLSSKRQFRLEGFALAGQVDYIESEIKAICSTSGDIFLKPNPLIPEISFALEANATIEINEAIDTISINNAICKLNDLPLNFSTLLILSDDMVDYALDFNAPSSDFKQLISLLPNFYKNRFDQINTQGSFNVNGNIKGNSNQEYPLYEIYASAKNGFIQYTDLPNSIDQVRFQFKGINNDPNSSFQKLEITELNAMSNRSSVNGDIAVSQFSKLLELKSDIEFYVDLKDLQNSILIKDGNELSGELRGTLQGSSSSEGQLKNLSGSLNSDQISFKSESDLQILERASIALNNNELDYEFKNYSNENFKDLNLSGSVSNPIEFINQQAKEIKGSLTISGREWTIQPVEPRNDSTEIGILGSWPQLDLLVNLQMENIIYKEQEIKEVSATLNWQGTTSEFSGEVGQFQNGPMKAIGTLNNLENYLLSGDTLSGSLNIEFDQINLDPFITSTNSHESSNGQLGIPDNIDLDLDYLGESIVFNSLDISNVVGALGIKDQKIIAKHQAKLFGGKIELSGILEPHLDSGYDIDIMLTLSEMSFKETAEKTKLFSKFIPIAKFLEGNYTATLNWNSKLDNDFLPDIETLSAIGTIQTADGAINSTLPIDTFIQKFTKREGKGKILLENAKSYFEIENGAIVVDEVQLEKGDYRISMSGSHGFNQKLNYAVFIDIPKSELNTASLADRIVDLGQFDESLQKASDQLFVRIESSMTGSTNQPKFQVKGVSFHAKGGSSSIAECLQRGLENRKDTLIADIKDSINSTVDLVKVKIDSTLSNGRNQLDSAIRSTKDTIESTIASLEDIVQNEEEQVLQEGRVLIDSIKAGNLDSLKSKFEEILKDKEGVLDRLKKKLPKKPGGK